MIELKLNAETVAQLKQQLADLLEGYGGVTQAAEAPVIDGKILAEKLEEKAKPKKKEKAEPKEPESQTDTPTISYDEVKKKATEVARKGAEYRDRVKAILKSHEVVRISDLPKESLEDVLSAIEAL